MEELFHPPVGFHFMVTFELFPQNLRDFQFQEVSGLSVEVETESIKEGGNNRFVHEVPIRSKYENLTLKRGMFIGSGIINWCKNGIENFDFKPVNVMISLLNENHMPLYNWHVINAIPKRWQIGA